MRAPAAVRDAALNGEVQRGAIRARLSTGDYLLNACHKIPGNGCAIARFCKRYIWFRENLVPTTRPMTVPMSAPATKSENQWMVMDTPRPI